MERKLGTSMKSRFDSILPRGAKPRLSVPAVVHVGVYHRADDYISFGALVKKTALDM